MSRCSHGVLLPYFCPLCKREERAASRPRRTYGPRPRNPARTFVVHAEELFDRGPLVVENATAREPEDAAEIVCKFAEKKYGGTYAAYLVVRND